MAGINQERRDELEEPLIVTEDEYEVPLAGDEEPVKSRNITIVLLYTFLAFAGRSLWSQSVLATYVFLLTNNNPEAVGFITAAMGLAQLLVSLPSGIFVDKYRRDTLLRTASLVGLFAIAVTIYSLFVESFRSLTISLSIWGVTWGIANTALSALFADSIHDGDRSMYFTQRATLIQLGICMGPLMALVLFACLGDHWTVRECAVVMGVGQAFCFPALMLLCFLSDDETVQERNKDQNSLTPVPSAQDLSLIDQEEEPRGLCCIPHNRIVPAFIAIADVCAGLGAGMSIRYFPVFFVQNLELNPVAVQSIYIISPLCQVCFMQVAQRLAKRFGRCKVSAMFKWGGASLMYLMVFAYLNHFPTWAVCILYLLRTSVINCTGALTKSVLMDNVPKKERGKWSALESVNMFSWSGSAALGGVLVGLEGIVFNFCVTAAIQVVATIPLVLLWSRETIEGSDVTVEPSRPLQSGASQPARDEH